MSRGIKLITFWFKQATQAGWTLAPLQQVSPVRLRFFRGFFLSPLYPLISFLLSFLQGVLAQERNANLFPPTLPPLRTAALTLASAAPRAHPPAAWHDYIWETSSSRPPSSVKVSYVGFVSYWLMLEKHYCCPLCVLFKFSFKKHKPGLPWEPKMEVMWELVTKEWGEAPGLGGAHLWGRVKLLDRKLKRAVKKKASRNRKNKPYPPKSHQEIHRIPLGELCLCDGSTIIARQKTNQSKEWLWKTDEKRLCVHIYATKMQSALA